LPAFLASEKVVNPGSHRIRFQHLACVDMAYVTMKAKGISVKAVIATCQIFLKRAYEFQGDIIHIANEQWSG
jgi:hypothetical protein